MFYTIHLKFKKYFLIPYKIHAESCHYVHYLEPQIDLSSVLGGSRKMVLVRGGFQIGNVYDVLFETFMTSCFNGVELLVFCCFCFDFLLYRFKK